ncbi:hypothetical protein [Deinococcus aquaticus]|uniref:YokE-like PH domain-containing protein n=1 Tax=Deinococcus aquaticus TaxID=328692 RepID=A0ABY7V6R4_9DEIO|nr:hypothetical protein [Deinococcus aquaticus]WDA60780.1 hypothetical protein M8445_17905 [Deinococcus aquaticus]
MDQKMEVKVASFTKLKQLALILKNDRLISLFEVARFNFGSIKIYGVASDGRIVATLDERLLFIHGGHIGIPDQDREILAGISAELRVVNTDIKNNIDKIFKEATEPSGRKRIKFIASLRDEGLTFLYDTPLKRVIKLGSSQAQPSQSNRKGKPTEPLAQRDWWNDPDRQHWE